MTQKHTPGPWQAVKSGLCSDKNAPWGVGKIVDGELKELPTTRANADLIAAAPTLLAEAIELLRNAVYEDGQAIVLTQDCEALQAAIAKAEGK